MYVVEKKIKGWIVLQYRIIITKYQNIAMNSFSIKQACARGCSKKMAVALHLTINVENKLFYTKYTRNNYRFR